MIALDTSVILAIALAEPEAEEFKRVLRTGTILIGWPTLFETRIVMSSKGFLNAQDIVARLAEANNVDPVSFDKTHYAAAEMAFDRFGKGRHSAALNMAIAFPMPLPRSPPLPFSSRATTLERRTCSATRHPSCFSDSE